MVNVGGMQGRVKEMKAKGQKESAEGTYVFFHPL